MRLFITKQLCHTLRVSGSISDDEAENIDEYATQDDIREIERDNKLTASIDDCDYWDGQVEDLQRDFEGDMARYADPKNSNELFYMKRATLAVQYLKLYCDK